MSLQERTRVSLKISNLHEMKLGRPGQRQSSRFYSVDEDIIWPQSISSRPIKKCKPRFEDELGPDSQISERPNQSIFHTIQKPVSLTSSHMIGVHISDTQHVMRGKAVINKMLVPSELDQDLVETQPLSSPRQMFEAGSSLNVDKPVKRKSTGGPAHDRLLQVYTDSASTTWRPIAQNTRPNIPEQQTKRLRWSISTNDNDLPQVKSTVDTLFPSEQMIALSESTKHHIEKKKRSKLIPSIMRKFTCEPNCIITCECSYQLEDSDMICCGCCDGWQHAHCYGFLSATDSRVPDYHICYTCLLGINEPPLLDEMKEIVLFRRALRYAWDDGKISTTVHAFASQLGK